MRDMSRKGRNVAQRPGARAGERNSGAILTWERVDAIRREYQLGSSVQDLADCYSISVYAIRDVVNGRRWLGGDSYSTAVPKNRK